MLWADLNYWAILVAAIATMIIGMAWYSSALFGTVWASLVGLKKEEMRSPAGPIIGSMVMAVLTSIFLALLLQLAQASGTASGLSIGLLVTLIVLAKIATNYFFESKSSKLFWITAGYHAVSLLVSAFILGVWR